MSNRNGSQTFVQDWFGVEASYQSTFSCLLQGRCYRLSRRSQSGQKRKTATFLSLGYMQKVVWASWFSGLGYIVKCPIQSVASHPSNCLQKYANKILSFCALLYIIWTWTILHSDLMRKCATGEKQKFQVRVPSVYNKSSFILSDDYTCI